MKTKIHILTSVSDGECNNKRGFRTWYQGLGTWYLELGTEE